MERACTDTDSSVLDGVEKGEVRWWSKTVNGGAIVPYRTDEKTFYIGGEGFSGCIQRSDGASMYAFCQCAKQILRLVIVRDRDN